MKEGKKILKYIITFGAVTIINPFLARYVFRFTNIKYFVLEIILNILLISIIGVYFYIKDKQAKKEISKKLNKIKKGDYRQKISIDQASKYFFITKELNQILKNIRVLFKELIESTVLIAEDSKSLNNNVNEITEMTNEISEAIKDVSSGAETQSINLEQTSEHFERLRKFVKKTDKNAKSVALTSEKASNIAIEGDELIAELISKSQRNQEIITNTREEIKSLKKSFNEVSNSVEIISEIAQQTDTLALNASIEAARAGKKGQGFGVLANEIRELSVKVDDSAQDIDLLISDVKEQIQHISEKMNQNVKLFKEQDEKTSEVGNKISKLNDIVSNNYKVINDLKEETEKVVNSIDEALESFDTVLSISQQTAANSQEVTASAENQRNYLSEVDKMADDLKENALDLQDYSSSKIMDEVMLNLCKKIRNEKNYNKLNKSVLNKLQEESNIDDIYIVNKEGQFILSTIDSIQGENLYEINEWAKEFLVDNPPEYVITPIHRRVEDDRLFKFAMLLDDDGQIIEVGMGLDSLVEV